MHLILAVSCLSLAARFGLALVVVLLLAGLYAAALAAASPVALGVLLSRRRPRTAAG